ncbi:MAG: RHS repeat-associated core domain-containing protein [Kiritimatiellae bacterium]|nr:RHS repeat-associated core domain-containing protein [Kiritimatiellia bacterium]
MTRRGGIQPCRAPLSSRNRASFKRDALGRVVEREERVLSGDPVTSRYEYDERGRLVSVMTDGVVSESYAYDSNGNRLGGLYDAQDRQLAFNGATYAYDLNGSMTNRNGVALTWNLFGRLMSVGAVAYRRDERQRNCYKEQDGESVKEWLWSGSRIVAEYDYADNTTSVFVYAGATAPAYMIRSGVTYRIITDNQGSVRLVVNAETSEVAQRIDYDSFGRVLRDTNPGFQPFDFQGGLYDPDTGLVEFGCRWYDAETGRWISKDPILLDGGWNVYNFCILDPINYHDGDGRAAIKIVVKTVKGLRKIVSRKSAKKVLKKGGSVNMEGAGVNKKAKRLAEEVTDQRIVRHVRSFGLFFRPNALAR